MIITIRRHALTIVRRATSPGIIRIVRGYRKETINNKTRDIIISL